jgi:hypothetical protein
LYQDLVIDFAMEEIDQDFPNWNYFGRHDVDDSFVFGSNDDMSFTSSEDGMDVSGQDTDHSGQATDQSDAISSNLGGSSQPRRHGAPAARDANQSDRDSNQRQPDSDQSASDTNQDATSGQPAEDESLTILTDEARIRVFINEEGVQDFVLKSRSQNSKEAKVGRELLYFLMALQDKVAEHIDHKELQIFTRHKRGTDVWRGHPNFRGNGPWNDWVMVDWAGEGKYPAHIHCFVDLSGSNLDQERLDHGGIRLKEGTYAVVETADYLEDGDYWKEEDMPKKNSRKWMENQLKLGKVERVESELFVPIKKEVGNMENGKVTQRKFYLADTEAFVDTCCAVPDIGGPTNHYFLVKPRSKWAKLFTNWLQSPHKYDEAIDQLGTDDK